MGTTNNCHNEVFNIKKDFIDYWDNVIKFWLSNPNSHAVDATRLSKKGENYYKDCGLEVNIEKDQQVFFTNGHGKLLYPAHMPEPYWGDPCNCSIVIVNYNPAGGQDMSLHSYKFTNGCPNFLPFPPNTMIDYVYKNSYSSLALDFPIWKKVLDNRKWLSSYAGRNWWLQKKEWIQHIVDTYCEDNPEEDKGKKKSISPFAIEICGWHSPNWRINVDNQATVGEFYDTINMHFVRPLIYALEKSKSKLAVCIGAQFSFAFLRIFIPCIKDESGTIFCKMKNNTNAYQIDYPKSCSKSVNSGDSIAVQVNNETRYYRVFDAYINGKHHVLLNTYAPGGNHHSAQHFWDFEKELLKATANYKSTVSSVTTNCPHP